MQPILIDSPYQRSLSIFDHTIFSFVLVLAVIPLARVPFSGTLVINVEFYAELAIAVLLVIRAIVFGTTKHFLPVLYFSFMVLLYQAFSSFAQRDFSLTMGHIITFLPFWIGCMLLWVGMTLPPQKIIIGLTLASACSALFMIYIQFINPELLLLSARDATSASGSISWGRTDWLNAPLSLLILLAYIFFDQKPAKNKILYVILVLFSLIGLLSTFSRTLIVAAILIMLSGCVRIVFKRNFQTLSRISLLLIVLTVGISCFIQSDPRLINLFDYRVNQLFKGNADVSTDVSDRFILFDQYRERFEEHAFSGQGLGAYFTSIPQDSYWSDVTLVSFILPFGIFGLVAFGLYICTILYNLLKVNNPELKPFAAAMIFLILISLLVSLNDDVWSHKSFIIFISIVVSSILRKKNLILS